jgi:hypothetical protein
MGARIVGRCHDVTTSNRWIAHVTMVKHGQALPLYKTRRNTEVVHFLSLREHSSRKPPSRLPQFAYVPYLWTLASKEQVRYQHFWQTEPPPDLSKKCTMTRCSSTRCDATVPGGTVQSSAGTLRKLNNDGRDCVALSRRRQPCGE